MELQDSAYPYHDWNERVTAECYAPNTASRVLDAQGRIARIINNYARISFNFGPTLLAWLENAAPEVYEAVLAADVESRDRFSGHGSALAQPYNHMILPLAHRRDKVTQVLWGVRDFEHRFRRPPEGIWLPETAVDLETLDILAELGIRFTVLAPHQAARVRRLEGRVWRDVSGAQIDPTRPYMLRLPSGREISIFFYDGPISRAVAFEGLLSGGEKLAGRLMDGFSGARSRPQLVHIATDGETYGHHHSFGDMALAYALSHIEADGLARLTNYGEFLERYPAAHEVEIIEHTSWSCAHGIERWRANCGCSGGGQEGWQQEWRGPLRRALDWLRDEVGPRYEAAASSLLRDPWAARDHYIEVVLDRSPGNVEEFLSRHAARPLALAEKVACLKLLELQRHSMLMYTSCGWFFDDVSGLETVQVLQYAGRVIQLAREAFDEALESRFLSLLEEAPSNVAEYDNGRRVYEKFVRAAVVGLREVAAHYAISSLFEPYGEVAKIHCYSVEREDFAMAEAGRAKLALGWARTTSEVTWETGLHSFGVLHLGDHTFNGGVREFRGQTANQAMKDQVSDAFAHGDLPEVIRLMDKHFEELTFSLRSLFRDEQRKIVDLVLSSTLSEVEGVYRQLYEHHALMMRSLLDLKVPLPRAFLTAAEFVLNTDLRRAMEAEDLDIPRILGILDGVATWGVDADSAGLAHALGGTLARLARSFRLDPADKETLLRLETAAGLARFLPFTVSLWQVQNVCFDTLQTAYPGFRARASEGEEAAQQWIDHFVELAKNVGVLVQ